MSGLPEPYLTPEQYLEIERKAETKSEYLGGEMFAMAGGTVRHGLLSLNLGGIIRQQLTGSNCIALPSDVRVCVSPAGLYTYPDLSVVCGEPELLDTAGDTVLNPIAIDCRIQLSELYDKVSFTEQR